MGKKQSKLTLEDVAARLRKGDFKNVVFMVSSGEPGAVAELKFETPGMMDGFKIRVDVQ